MKRVRFTVVALLALLAAYLWAAPYITIVAISNGLLDRDSEALRRHVDFPALKQGLKDQSDALWVKDGRPDTQKDVLSSLGRMIGSRVIHGVIDSAVTPEGMIFLAGEAGLTERGREMDRWWRRVFAPFVRTRYGYDSFSRFSYWLPTDEGELQFVLRRSGIRWRMTNVMIPPDLLKQRFMKWAGRK